MTDRHALTDALVERALRERVADPDRLLLDDIARAVAGTPQVQRRVLVPRPTMPAPRVLVLVALIVALLVAALAVGMAVLRPAPLPGGSLLRSVDCGLVIQPLDAGENQVITAPLDGCPGNSLSLAYAVSASADGRTLAYGVTCSGCDHVPDRARARLGAWVWDAASGGSRQIAPCPDGDLCEVWVALSPDAGRLAYMVWDRQSLTAELAIIGLKDSSRQSFEVRYASDPAWAPDGQSLALASGSSLFRVWPAEGRMELLTELPDAVLTRPSWAPDGRHLMVDAWLHQITSVQVVEAAGGPAQALVTSDSRNQVVRGVGWAPNGNRVAYLTFSQGGPPTPLAVHVKDVATLDETTAFATPDACCYGAAVAWSPDGSWLAIATRQPVDGKLETILVRPDGTGARHLAVPHFVTWLPNH